MHGSRRLPFIRHQTRIFLRFERTVQMSFTGGKRVSEIWSKLVELRQNGSSLSLENCLLPRQYKTVWTGFLNDCYSWKRDRIGTILSSSVQLSVTLTSAVKWLRYKNHSSSFWGKSFQSSGRLYLTLPSTLPLFTRLWTLSEQLGTNSEILALLSYDLEARPSD